MEDLTPIYGELKEIQNIFKNDVILDGEIVAFENGLPSFSLLQSRSHIKDKKKIEAYTSQIPVCFVCFDILYLNKDLSTLPLIERKKILSHFDDTDTFIKSTYIKENGIELFEKIKKKDLEGIVAKKIDSIYEPDHRTHNWIKIKNLKSGSFYVGGYSLNKVNASVYLGEYKEKKFFYIGKVSVPQNKPFYKELQDAAKLKTSPFQDKIIKDATYLKPTLKIKVKYLEKTRSGSLRQPIFISKG